MVEWQPLDEQERLAIVGELIEEHPALDLANSLSGALAGPASPDRPDLPVWDYPDLVRRNPTVSWAQLAAIRFPVLFFEGESSVTSIDEELRPLPSHLEHRPQPRFVLDAEAVVRRYSMERDAGLVEWDARSRGIRYLTPVAGRRSVVQAWVDTLTRTA